MAAIPEALTIAREHHVAWRLDQADQIYRQILRLDPNHDEALHLLGVLAGQRGNLAEAVACYQHALRIRPDHAQAHYNLGNTQLARGQPDEAMACFQRAVELEPDFAEAHNNLGSVLQSRGQRAEALTCFRRAVELKPDYVEAHANLGMVWHDLGQWDQAATSLQRALLLGPDLAAVHNNLGVVLQSQGQLDEAAACLRRAVALEPSLPEAHNNLGNVLTEQGELTEALACYERALELKPDYVEAHSNLIYTINFCPGRDSRTVYQEHCRWNRLHAEPLAKPVPAHDNVCAPDRRLRIGYVSPDFCGHVVGLFLLPLLEAHDREGLEIYCYASVPVPDALTERCRSLADVWRDVIGLSDAKVADMIRQDRIDILVDLSMHLKHHRLLVFARKPAPVQVTYLAYCGTTGLGAIDYRLTDPYLDPPDHDDGRYSEQSIRLPQTYWCYRPATVTPPVCAPPVLEAAHVTFGCLNAFCKVTTPTLATWGRLLQRVPAARLLLHAQEGSHRDKVRDLLVHEGIAPERIAFVRRVATVDYFKIYARMDIALDPFPYGGGTTTCDALWMGVPVVSLLGQTAVGRGGLSILSNIGMAELVARDADEYVRIASELAGDRPRLTELRATLRARLQNSPLMDAPRFARNVEAAYRNMWQRWCLRQPRLFL